MIRQRLQTIGIVLLVLGLAALAFNFVARSAQRRETEAFASRLDTLSIRIDDSFELPEQDRDRDALLASVEDARGELTGIKHSHGSLTSATNLSFFLYSGLTIAGSACLIAGARLSRNPN